MSRHHITTNLDDGTEIRIWFTFHPGQPERDPSYASGGEPAEPAHVEFESVQELLAHHWRDIPELDAWAEAYLQGDGSDDAMTTAADDYARDRAYAAEMRADSWRDR